MTSVNSNPIFFAWEGHDVNDIAITGTNDNSITIGTISGDETTVEADSVEKANELLASESVDKVVLTGTVDSSSTALSVPKNKTLVIANDVTITGTETNPIEIGVGGIIEVNTTSSYAKSFTIKGGDQTGEVTFTNVSGNFTITGGSVIVSGDYNGTITGSGTVDVKLTGNISGDVNITWSGTGGNVIFDNATLSSNCKVTLDPNNITYSVNGELRVYGQILNSTAGSGSMTDISIAVEGDDTVKAYASATIGNGIYFKGDGNIDLGSSMSTGYWSEDIASDMTWSQAQKTIIDGTMTIKSGYTLTVLGELVIDEGVTVSSRQERLTEIFGNLIRNAARYNKSGGSVTVRVRGGHTPFAEVEDTGIGIAEENLDKIFSRFFTVDKSHSGKNGGFGLGLAVVRKLCDRAGWKLTVRSKLGEGTCFRIEF